MHGVTLNLSSLVKKLVVVLMNLARTGLTFVALRSGSSILNALGHALWWCCLVIQFICSFASGFLNLARGHRWRGTAPPACGGMEPLNAGLSHGVLLREHSQQTGSNSKGPAVSWNKPWRWRYGLVRSFMRGTNCSHGEV